MAEHDTKPEVVTTEVPELKTRRYTVGYIRDWKTHNAATGTPLKIRVMPGCLVLTAQEPLPVPPPEPEIMQTLRKVCKLSARKQRQVTELIEVISKLQRQNGN